MLENIADIESLRREKNGDSFLFFLKDQIDNIFYEILLLSIDTISSG